VFSYISSLAINTTAILVDDQKDMTCIWSLKYYKIAHKHRMRIFGQSSWGYTCLSIALPRLSTSGWSNCSIDNIMLLPRSSRVT
jgi:hypothetical protein